MKAWMAALIGGAPEIETLTFTSNATWTATGVSQLLSIEGKGGAGEPEFVEYGYTLTTVTTRYNSSGTQISQSTGVGTFYGEYAPRDDYCEGSFGSGGTRTETCYYYANFDNSTPQTTGASASAFGYTFPGGVGGPASTLTYGNVSVVPGNSYGIVVPAGGQVKITYYK